MDVEQARLRVADIRAAGDAVSTGDLEAVWSALPAVRPEDILGSWKGYAVATGHRVEAMLKEAKWYGKNFKSISDVHPLICRDADGQLYSNIELGQGKATLRADAFRGETTACMVYDGRPIRDYFKQVDEHFLLGVMDGSDVLDEGRHFYFILERDN
ncbi:DUF4334 domain-containing protein [Streptomyces sp. NPDC048506]|uniref:DUF4334 domain-containing protein n=1 Tax=Streptomyces sp. NPDC048506 TaxID=3155028 RepID=UPI00343AD8CE